MKKKTTFTFALKNLLISIFLLFFFAAGTEYAKASIFDAYTDMHSASHSSAPFASLQNPVFSDIDEGSAFAYRFMIHDGSDNANHLMNIRLMGLSFTYGYFADARGFTAQAAESPAHFFNINKGFFLGNIIGFGLGYSFSKSDQATLDNYRAWSFGFLLRPLPFLSFGMAFNDVGAKIGGVSLPHRETYSLSLRPLTDRVTLSLDMVHEGGESFGDMDYIIGGEVRLPRDISLFYKTDTNWNMRFGIALPLYFRGPRSSTLVTDYYRTTGSPAKKEINSLGFSFPLSHYSKGIPIRRKDTLLTLRLNRKVEEIEQDGLFSRRKICFTEIIQCLKRGLDDENITGLLLHIEADSFGFAQVQELRREMKKYRRAGKKVYAIMYHAGNREYYLASAADRIYFTPNSPFKLTALAARVYFFKDLMTKAGIEFEEIRRGAWKSANESFTRSHLSEEARNNLTSLLTNLNGQYLRDIMADRKLSQKTIDRLLAEGTVTPKEARRRGFIDRVMYEREARNEISDSITTVRLSTYMTEKEKRHRWGLAPAIAVVHVTGSIIRGKSSGRGFSNATGDKTYRSDLRAAFGNPAVKAVIIRINSGGGSASASDYMLKDLKDLKKKTGKPVIFSFGNVAASGGYYIAATGDPLFASPGTITGSIGVISGKLSLAGLYKKLGINKDVIKLSEFADIYDESRKLTERERKVLQKGVDFIYDRFTGVVMKARQLSDKEISSRAEGRVFTGSQARKKKLTDHTGGLAAALEMARMKARVPEDCRLLIYPGSDARLREMFETEDIKMIRRLYKTLFRHFDAAAFSGERYLFRIPWRIEVR